MLQITLFYILSAVLLAAAIGVITSRNTVYSALFLVLAFVCSSGLWLMADAEFLAIALVLVYVGAVMVLFLFVVMMLDVNVEELRKGFTRYAPLGVLTALVVIAEIAYVVWHKKLGLPDAAVAARPAGYSNTEALGSVLYTEHFYPFELAAVILLVAIVAAIVLTMRRRRGLVQQDIAKQVAVRAEDRVRLVKMSAEEPKS